MKKDNQTIKCDVESCKYHEERYCSLDKIKVAPCRAENDKTKEATMCDSFES